jgi:serine/threonine protein kinase
MECRQWRENIAVEARYHSTVAAKQIEADKLEEQAEDGYVPTPLELIKTTTRYQQDFEELGKLGQGGFGSVYKARQRVDGKIYAIKKIKLRKKGNNQKIQREITCLADLNNPHIVRYYQTWVETESDK